MMKSPKFAFLKSQCSRNSHCWNLNFPTIHIFEISNFAKFTFLKSHFSQNSHFWIINFVSCSLFKYFMDFSLEFDWKVWMCATFAKKLWTSSMFKRGLQYDVRSWNWDQLHKTLCHVQTPEMGQSLQLRDFHSDHHQIPWIDCSFKRSVLLYLVEFNCWNRWICGLVLRILSFSNHRFDGFVDPKEIWTCVFPEHWRLKYIYFSNR